MIRLKNTLASWNSPDFEQIFQQEVQSLSPGSLPLQQALSFSNQVHESEIKVMVISAVEQHNVIIVKAGIFFCGIDAGSCCADDPSTITEQPEYGELVFAIDRLTGDTVVSLHQ